MLNTARVLTLIGSLAIVVFGVLAGAACLLVGAFAPASERLTLVTLGASLLALCGGLGSAMAWQSSQAIQDRPSRPFAIPSPGLLAISFLCAVALGQLALSLDLLPVLVLPPLHIVAAALPPVLVLALVAKGLGLASSRRDVILQLGSGAFLSTALALTLELLLVVGLTVVLITALMVSGGLETLMPLMDRLQDPTMLQDPSALAPLAHSPLIVAALFLLFAVAIPVIEEAVKTVGVGLFSYKRPTRAESFFWGVACGGGFALAEGLFNSVVGLDRWGAVVLLRLGATLLHCLTGGLMGLAWYTVVSERWWARGLGLFACSVGIHGFWNAVSISLTLVSLTSALSEADLAETDLSMLATVVLFGLLAAAVVGIGLSLVVLTRHVRCGSAAAGVSEILEGESHLQVPEAMNPETTTALSSEAGDNPDS